MLKPNRVLWVNGLKNKVVKPKIKTKMRILALSIQ